MSNTEAQQAPYQTTTPVAYIAHESEEMVHVRRAELRYWAKEALEIVKNPLEGASAWATSCAGIAATAALRAYPGWVVARVASCAFLNAMRPLESCRRARWFSSFLDQRMRIPRLRFSQEWQASTTQRRAFHSGLWAFSSISSPRARMCGVSA